LFGRQGKEARCKKWVYLASRTWLENIIDISAEKIAKRIDPGHKLK